MSQRIYAVQELARACAEVSTGSIPRSAGKNSAFIIPPQQEVRRGSEYGGREDLPKYPLELAFLNLFSWARTSASSSATRATEGRVIAPPVGRPCDSSGASTATAIAARPSTERGQVQCLPHPSEAEAVVGPDHHNGAVPHESRLKLRGRLVRVPVYFHGAYGRRHDVLIERYTPSP